MIEQYTGTLIGCAIGDSLGMAVEGWKREQILQHAGTVRELRDPVLVHNNGSLVHEDEHGRLKYWNKHLRRGQWTDDTILTCAIAQSIVLRGGVDIRDIAYRQLSAYKNSVRERGTTSGFGRTTQDAFRKLQDEGYSSGFVGVTGGPGNGPAMKTSPLGLYMHATKDPESLDHAAAVARLTHRDPRSVASGVVQTYAINALLEGTGRDTFLEQVCACCIEEPVTETYLLAEEGTLAKRLLWVRDNTDTTTDDAYELLGNSSKVYESYPFTLFMFQKYWDDPVEGLVATVNYGGDCDTTGAIFGALAGARHGMCFPEWPVEGREFLEKTGRRLYEL